MEALCVGLGTALIFFLVAVEGQSPPGAGPPGFVGITEPPTAATPGNSVDEALLQACIDKLVRTNPSIKKRYSDKILRDSCNRNVEWQHMVRNLARNETATAAKRPQFTASQLAWLHSVYKCHDLTCLCDDKNATSPFCVKAKPTKPVFSNDTQFDRPLTRHRRQNLDVDNTLQDRAGRSLRPEIRQMSDDDRNRYFRAMNNIKFDQVDGMSKYDILVLYHTPEYAPEAHFSAALLPYHREMLKNLEIVLRMTDPGVALPYWDTTMDAPLPNPADSVLWTNEFFGNGFGDVTSGPFGNWFALRDNQVNPSRSGRIVRSTGSQGSLLSDQDVNTIFGKQRFRNLVYCVDPFLETAHGANHMWVGGHMLTLRVSPNDPVFYNLHTFIDLIWEQWRFTHQSYNQRQNDYVFNNEACNQASVYNARMQPFPVTNGQGLSNRYTEVFYTYTNRPACPDCGSRYLFCDTRQNKCISKVRSGGSCNGYEGFDVCYNSQCVSGRCSGSGGGGGGGRRNNNNLAVTSGCRNNHACCTYWASTGECNQNPSWMRSNCQVACGACSGGNACGDSHPRCAEWASQGECQTNPAWMITSCPLSCGTCNTNFGAAECDNNGGGRQRCQNNDNRCNRWASEGECNINRDWMLPNCALACNSCP